MTVITEAELREMWQNGKGNIPSFPTGTRFTPAAQDFLKAQRIEVRVETQQPALSARLPEILPPGRIDLHAPSGPKVIYTERDIEELARSGVTSLVMTPEMYLTDIAREKLAALGIRIVRPGQASRAFSSASEIPSDLQPAKRTYYTESDVIELARGGMTVMHVNENVQFTASAQERLMRLGIRVVRGEAPPARGIPVQDELFQKVKSAVLARIGGQVNEAVLDAVIRKVLSRLKE